MCVCGWAYVFEGERVCLCMCERVCTCVCGCLGERVCLWVSVFVSG